MHNPSTQETKQSKIQKSAEQETYIICSYL